MPADHRGACGKLSARDWIAEDARIPQRAVVRQRTQRISDIAGTDRGGSRLMEASRATPSAPSAAEMVGAGKMSAAMSPAVEMGVTAAKSTMTATMSTVAPAAMTTTMTAAASRKCRAGQCDHQRGNGDYHGELRNGREHWHLPVPRIPATLGTPDGTKGSGEEPTPPARSCRD
jgi:hypothetical protein